MTTKEFNKMLNRRLKKIRITLKLKAKEYAMEDRLHNFKIAARMNNTTSEKALWGMLTKHLISVMDMIEGRKKITRERIDEKVGDTINYFVLLEGVLNERI